MFLSVSCFHLQLKGILNHTTLELSTLYNQEKKAIYKLAFIDDYRLYIKLEEQSKPIALFLKLV